MDMDDVEKENMDKFMRDLEDLITHIDLMCPINEYDVKFLVENGIRWL